MRILYGVTGHGMGHAMRAIVLARHLERDHGQCPSPPVPTEPPSCLFELRCADGQCVNDCE